MSKVDFSGEGFHAALRKRCDSFPASIAWSAIREMGLSWEWFADQLRERAELIQNLDLEQRGPGGNFAEVFRSEVLEQIQILYLELTRRHEWLDGQPLTRREKGQESYHLLTLLRCLGELEEEELRGCLEWGGILKEEE